MNGFCRVPFRATVRRPVNGCVRYSGRAGGAAVVGALLLLAGSSLTACDRQEPSQLTAEREAAVKDTIRSLVTVGPFPDPEPYLQLYAQEAPLYTEGRRLARDQHEQLVRGGYPALTKIEVEPSDAEVDVLGPRAAVASILLRGHVTDTAGERRKLSGAITQVYRLRDGEWRVVQAHESFAPGKSF